MIICPKCGNTGELILGGSTGGFQDREEVECPMCKKTWKEKAYAIIVGVKWAREPEAPPEEERPTT